MAEKAIALSQLPRAHLQKGEEALALESIRAAEQMAEFLKVLHLQSYYFGDIFLELGKVAREAGQAEWSRALWLRGAELFGDFVEEIGDQKSLTALAVAFAEIGDVSVARRLSASISGSRLRSRIESKIREYRKNRRAGPVTKFRAIHRRPANLRVSNKNPQLSPKQQLYVELLRVIIPHLRNRETWRPWHRFRSVYAETELIHNLPRCLEKFEFGREDFWWLNHQARVYLKRGANDAQEKFVEDLIRRIFAIVPADQRELLEWPGPL